mgnify:CR=1 FL=1
MKAKSDTATNAYPINVTIEYEYDGIKPNPATGEIGEKQEYDLNLQVVENARPVVDYVNVYSWDRGVTVNNPASLSFEFYNMGKSTLNNVVATVEGDFMPSGASMYFLGNVMAGGNAYAEYEVIPIVEGTAYGTVKCPGPVSPPRYLLLLFLCLSWLAGGIADKSWQLRA